MIGLAGEKILLQNFLVTTYPTSFQHVDRPPRIEIVDSKYLVRFARNAEEIEAALKLRFEVFNLELEEGLASSFQTGRDRDEFDATCHHLIAIDQANDRVVGTYRLRTIEMAGDAEGFYSSGEFDLSYLPREVLNQSVELGRACIAQSHRNRQVLFLLWKALALYVASRRKRFLFGCCSLTSQQAGEGNQLLRQLTDGGHLHATVRVPPQPGYECTVEDSDDCWSQQVKVPRLFRTYLGIGAKVCSAPAIDRKFKTIDFFMLFDIQKMNAATRKLFFGV
jgi:putative hemolysin